MAPIVEVRNGSFPSRRLQSIEKTWRDYRTYTSQQRLAADFLTNQGVFAARPLKTPYLLYGGAAWGGKSYWERSMAFELCMVLRDLGFPNQWGAIYCDTFPNLQARHISKLEEEMQGLGTVQTTDKRGLHIRWHGEGLGGVYLKNIVSASNLSKGKGSGRGAEVVFSLTDELTELLREQWAGVMYQTRSGIPNFPFTARGHATNPDGIGHQWVKELFVPEFRNLEDPYFKRVSADNFFYVPALPSDNPAFATEGDTVLGNLAAIEDEDIRRARENGDWNLYSNGRFHMFRREVHTFNWVDLFERYGIPEHVTPRKFLRDATRWGFEIYASLDFGTSPDSISAYLLHLVDPDGRPWTFFEMGMSGMELDDQAEAILAVEKGLPIHMRFADPSIGGKAQSTDQKTRQERFFEHGLHFELGINDRVEGASTVASLLHVKYDGGGNVTREPKWRILRQVGDGFGCPELIRQIPSLPRSKFNPEDVDKRDGKNHWYDSARYFLHTRFMGSLIPEDPIKPYSAAYYRQLAVNQRPQKPQSQWR